MGIDILFAEWKNLLNSGNEDLTEFYSPNKPTSYLDELFTIPSETSKTRAKKVAKKSEKTNQFLQEQNAISENQNKTTIGDTISEGMLNNLHHAEGEKNWTAHAEKKNFGENFVTGPLGMVYKYDSNGKIIGKWKEGETCTKEYAIQNAKNHYKASFQEWKKLLEGFPGVTQHKLDALVATSDGTLASRKATMEFVKTHWNDQKAITDYIGTHATKAAGNGKVMPGLVYRRAFEAAWYNGDETPYRQYQKERKGYKV